MCITLPVDEIRNIQHNFVFPVANEISFCIQTSIFRRLESLGAAVNKCHLRGILAGAPRQPSINGLS